MLSKEACEYMKSFDPSKVEDGRYELGNGVYATISTYTTKLRKDATYEAHKKYTDVQWIICGREIISWEPLETMHQHACVKPYSQEKDIEKYESNTDGIDSVLNAGDYAVYTPQIAHMPCICIDKQSTVRKVVIKIPAAQNNAN